MRTWGFLPSQEELAAFMAPLQAFRERWSSIRPPFPASFDGGLEDVHALDYMNYENISFPHAGVEGPAMVCGEVIRRAAGLEWVISYRGDWFVASREDSNPSVAISPVARLHEIECGGGAPQFGKHLWLVQRAAFECLLLCDPQREPALLAILDDDGDYLERVERTLRTIKRCRP